MKNNSNDNLNVKDFWDMIDNKEQIFQDVTKWSEETKKDFALMLKKLKDNNFSNAQKKGAYLEEIVSFIIEHSFFLKIYRNVHTGTNEIDEVIEVSDRGKIALQTLNLPLEILGIDSNIFIGECKNYADRLNVTYVGKFYSLLVNTNTPLGIIFTPNGLTGNESEYKDAHGLVKVLHIIEKAKNNNDLYILTFTLDDFDKLLDGYTLFDLIKSKKNALKLSSNYESFLSDNRHEGIEPISNQISAIS